MDAQAYGELAMRESVCKASTKLQAHDAKEIALTMLSAIHPCGVRRKCPLPIPSLPARIQTLSSGLVRCHLGKQRQQEGTLLRPQS